MPLTGSGVDGADVAFELADESPGEKVSRPEHLSPRQADSVHCLATARRTHCTTVLTVNQAHTTRTLYSLRLVDMRSHTQLDDRTCSNPQRNDVSTYPERNDASTYPERDHLVEYHCWTLVEVEREILKKQTLKTRHQLL